MTHMTHFPTRVWLRYLVEYGEGTYARVTHTRAGREVRHMRHLRHRVRAHAVRRSAEEGSTSHRERLSPRSAVLPPHARASRAVPKSPTASAVPNPGKTWAPATRRRVP